MAKPRLKVVQRPRVNDDWQHCCRWCKHYCYSGDPTEGYKCYNKDVMGHIVERQDMINMYSVSENGYAAETIEEVLNDGELTRKFFNMVLSKFDEWNNVSQKKKAEFEKHLQECWSEFADFSLKEELDEALMKCYVHHLEDEHGSFDNGVDIDNPSEFVCKYWE